MNKKCVLLILLVCLAVLLAGCGHRLTEGIVIKKEFVPAKTQIVPVVAGKTVVPVRRTISEKWRILVSGHTEAGEEIQEWWEVTEECWRNLSIGYYVNKEEQNEQ